MNKRIRKKKAPGNISNAIVKLTKRICIENFELHVLYGNNAPEIKIEDDCAEIKGIKRNLKWIAKTQYVQKSV